MGVPETVKRLSHDQRELLIAHVPEPQLIDYRPDADGRNARRTTNAMVRLGLVREDHAGNPKVARFTVITELGREVAAGVLAIYAEHLVRAGFGDELKNLHIRPRVMDEVRLMTTSAAALELTEN